MRPGDVVWVDFPGAVQTKRRPAIVLSSPAYHAARPDVIVGLVTSQTAKATAPTDHLIRDWQQAGLRVPSSFRAYVITIPRASVVRRVGTLTTFDRREVAARVRLSIEAA